jgi:hypothetical protein
MKVDMFTDDHYKKMSALLCPSCRRVREGMTQDTDHRQALTNIVMNLYVP